jgi:superfamily II DNA or RNA helicase
MSALNPILTVKGYSILKAGVTKPQEAQILKELVVAPKTLPKFSKGVQSFRLYLESAARYYVPKAWGLRAFGPPEGSTVPSGLSLPAAVRFKGNPYPYQQTIIDTFIGQGANGLICVPCGRGKTFMALSILVRLGTRALIVVDKEFLMNQWKGEIERYVEGARVGILQGPKAETDPALYDITICMIQTVCLRDWVPGTFSGYGLTIFDECHHLGAQHFSGVLKKIQTDKMLGLSATPDRDDGLTKVFEYYLGKPVYQEKTRDPDPTVTVRAVWFTSEDPAYKEPPRDWKGEIVTARLLTQLVECEPRTRVVLEHLKEMAADPRRKILVLSERKAHLAAIELSLPPGTVRGYYVGGMKQADLDKNADTCQVLLATYAMASEAMNIKALNAMIMASPRKKVEQSTGRILRTSVADRAVEPLIIDVIDSHDMYVNQWYQRQRYYKKCAYTIEHVGKPSKTTREVEEAQNVVLAGECAIRLS